jgi:hypothetical protein
MDLPWLTKEVQKIYEEQMAGLSPKNKKAPAKSIPGKKVLAPTPEPEEPEEVSPEEKKFIESLEAEAKLVEPESEEPDLLKPELEAEENPAEAAPPAAEELKPAEPEKTKIIVEIKDVGNFEDLYEVLSETQKENFQEIKENIQVIRNVAKTLSNESFENFLDGRAIGTVTRKNGLRDKVIELLRAEKNPAQAKSPEELLDLLTVKKTTTDSVKTQEEKEDDDELKKYKEGQEIIIGESYIDVGSDTIRQIERGKFLGSKVVGGETIIEYEDKKNQKFDMPVYKFLHLQNESPNPTVG